jgi:hypothetical protein
MARIRTGFGLDSLRLDSGRSSRRSMEDGAFALGASIDLGVAPIRNLVVRARAGFWADIVRDSPFAERGGFTFGLLGAGVDYYIMPANLYFGATIGVAGAYFIEEYERGRYSDTRHSRAGVGVELDVGKEWWIASEIGIGVALRARYVDVAPANMFEGYDGRLHAFHLSVELSATYN